MGKEKEVKKSAQESLQKAIANKHKYKKLRFITIRALMSYFASQFMKDTGKIPDNIGNNMLITNNMYITKLYMSSIIQIKELGAGSVITLIGEVNRQLRSKGNKCILDVSIKNEKYRYEPNNSGLTSRIRAWEKTLDMPWASKKSRERAARCLYTVKQAASGKQLKQSRIFLTLRAKDIDQLNAGEKIVYTVLDSMGSQVEAVYGSLKDRLDYISIVGGRAVDINKVASVMTSNQVLADMTPNVGAYNDKVGIQMGVNIWNGSPYVIDFSRIAVARNLYIVAPSGVGKTVLAMNIAQSGYENGCSICMMDIKGNEYSSFIQATGGYIVSLRPTSTEYINSWIMRKEDTSFENAEMYFKARVQFSKQQIIILSGITDKEKLIELEELLDEFHHALYVYLGVSASNPKSWSKTLDLSPYEVYDRFVAYCTPQKRQQYNISNNLLGTLKMYMSRSGSKSYVFTREFDYASILNANTVSFDFGILASNNVSDVDMDLFKLKFLYMRKLNSEFITRKYSLGIETIKILEESQVIDDSLMKMYVEEYTLRRSQRQHTILIGNSVQALMDNELAKPLIENTTGLLVGDLTDEARNLVLKSFHIEYLRDKLDLIGSRPEYKNTFLFFNKMQDRQLFPLLKVVLDPEADKPKVLIPVKEGLLNEENT